MSKARLKAIRDLLLKTSVVSAATDSYNIDTTTFTLNGVNFACPWCGKNVGAGIILETGDEAAIHSEPMCAKFRDLDVLEYLEQVNTKLASLNN